MATLANILVKPSALVLVPATLIYFAILALWPLRGRRSWIATNVVIFLAIVPAGVVTYGLAFKDRFGAFLGLINMAEALRFLVNVQDLIVVAGVLVAALTVQQWRRMVPRLARALSSFSLIPKCGTRR